MVEFLFAYGSLQDKNVQKEILGRSLVGNPDILENYAIQKNILIDNLYPVITKAPGESVMGAVFTIKEDDLHLLDSYEGESY